MIHDPTVEVNQVLMRWKNFVENNDLEGVLSLYSPDANLWGTLSEYRRDNPSAIRQYFEKFIAHDHIRVNIIDHYTRIYDNIAISSGAYDFTWTEAGKKILLRGRYSFVFHHSDDQWHIIDHHSSITPESPFDVSKYVTE